MPAHTTAVAVTQGGLVTETVTVRPTTSPARGYLLRADADWTWQDLRDYVVAAIEQRHGPFPRNPAKERAIFSGFLGRWQEFAAEIARHAFEGPDDGWWGGAPIGVNRFCAGSDEYFARKIADRLLQLSPADH